MKKHFWLGFTIAALLAGSALAQSPPAPPPPGAPPPPLVMQRTISVSGEAHEDVAPDQAVLSMSLVSKDKNLITAKKNNDAQIEKLVAIARSLNIPKEKIGTSGIYIAPEYTYENNRQQFVGYTVNRSFRVTMNATDIHEKLLSAIVDAKIDQVNGLNFQLSNPETHAAALRVKAFEDAKAKAQALAQAAGGKLGPAITITTMDAGQSYPRPPMPMAMAAMARGGAESSVAPSLPGMVTLSESVSVMFGLE